MPRRTLVIIAVAVALAVLGTVLALTLGGGGDDGAKGGESDGAKTTTSSGATSGSDKGDDTKKADDATGKDGGSGDKSGSDSGSDAKDDKKASPGEDASASGGSKGDDGSASGSGSAVAQTYRSAQGFSIGLPKGWKYQSSDAAGARFTGPDGQKLLVGWTATPKDDPVADWKNQERGMVRPQYKKVRIEAVEYRDYNTADWEFTYVDGGTKYRSIDRGFVVNAHQGYALMYTAKASAWDGALREKTWKTLTETFQPKS